MGIRRRREGGLTLVELIATAAILTILATAAGTAGWPVPGVHVPYEEPLNPDVTIDTQEFSAAEAADAISRILAERS